MKPPWFKALPLLSNHEEHFSRQVYFPLKSRLFEKLQTETATGFQGSSPNVFVGRFGYPQVNVGILSPPEQHEEAWKHDAPKYWAGENYRIPQVIDLRGSLINARFGAHITDARKTQKLLELCKEIGMAKKPVDVEVNLSEKPQLRINQEPRLGVYGPKGKLKSAVITSNPSIGQKVEKVVAEDDLKANEGMMYLYKAGYDEQFLTKLLSIGNLGIKAERKLVPTRWSITASDDIIAKNLLKKVRDFPLTEHMAYFGGYLGNYYLILFFPQMWGYELFETYAPQTNSEIKYSTDYEGYAGRTTYAEHTVGGYYACRLALVEKLMAMKHQAAVLALRFITDDYYTPLGVWVVRQSTRKALESKPISFSDKELLIHYVRIFVKKRFHMDADQLLNKSLLLKTITQKRLDAFV
ncbi:hypothetical protein HYW21_04625 [Candidatus Woesearchaeota archaeon]|nr:hypothetical protein [Candidatus Woesearchaeota archaeon]